MKVPKLKLEMREIIADDSGANFKTGQMVCQGTTGLLLGEKRSTWTFFTTLARELCGVTSVRPFNLGFHFFVSKMCICEQIWKCFLGTYDLRSS